MIYDRKFEVTKNRGCNHIHGGRIGFDKVPWNLSEIHENGVTFSHRSPHGHEGYPGEVFATVRYTIHPDNSLRIYMTAKTDMTTLVNMTNHTYFNLAGHVSILQSDNSVYAGYQKYVARDEIRSVRSITFMISSVHNACFKNQFIQLKSF